MTPRRAPCVLASFAVAALALSACQNLGNPFSHAPKASTASPGERISLLELNDQLNVSDALKGQDFYLPPPQTVDSWPLPGGTPEQSVEHVDAAPEFQIAWRANFGAGTNKRLHVTAPPIMADGKVFVMDGAADVSAHDARTGQVQARPRGLRRRRRLRRRQGLRHVRLPPGGPDRCGERPRGLGHPHRRADPFGAHRLRRQGVRGGRR
jgi:hypothetical protein